MRAALESMTGEHVRMPVHMHLTAVVGAHPVLEITDGVHTARVSGAETVAQAQSRATIPAIRPVLLFAERINVMSVSNGS